MTPPSLSRAIAKFTRAAIGLQKIREKDSIARTHTPVLEQFFKAQARLVIFQMQFMQEYMPEVQQAEPVRLMEAKPPTNPEALKRWADIWDDVEQHTTDELRQIVKGIEGDGLLKGAAQLAAQMRFDPKSTFSLSNPRAVAWMRKNGGSVDLIKGIQDTTAESLKRVITTGLDEGWSYNTTAREIQKLYDGPISKDRAQLIAVTESARSYEAGNRAFADTLTDDGIEMEKMWTTSHDDRVSDGCATNEADGWIPIDEPHTSGDQEPPRFPGCRCYEQYRQASREMSEAIKAQRTLSAIGPQGERGEQGIPGPKGERGPQGIPGPKGEKGDRGDTGPTGPQGDPGQDGSDGKDGDDGLSAYEIWINAGHSGTEKEFLKSLKGPQGATGARGLSGGGGGSGPAGPAGADGADGADGAQGPQGPAGTIGSIAAYDEKTAPVSADILLIEDSEDTYTKKRVQIGNLPGGTGTGIISDPPAGCTKIVNIFINEDGDVSFQREDGTY